MFEQLPQSCANSFTNFIRELCQKVARCSFRCLVDKFNQPISPNLCGGGSLKKEAHGHIFFECTSKVMKGRLINLCVPSILNANRKLFLFESTIFPLAKNKLGVQKAIYLRFFLINLFRRLKKSLKSYFVEIRRYMSKTKACNKCF